MQNKMAKQKKFKSWIGKKISKEQIAEDEKIKRDAFSVSFGNLEVLARIPYMMADPKWREQLRKLVLEFICEDTLKRNSIKYNYNSRNINAIRKSINKLRSLRA